MTKKKLLEKFPMEDGWWHMDIHFQRGKQLDERGCKVVSTMGKVDRFDFAHIEILKTKAKVVLRTKRAESPVTDH